MHPSHLPSSPFSFHQLGSASWLVEMETELQNMDYSPTRYIDGYKEPGSPLSAPLADLKYTSLKDIIPWPSSNGTTSHDASGFDSSNISIKNQLVKQAASAYLQSAAILATRNQNCLVRMWHRVASRAVRSSLRMYVGNPLRACIGYVTKPILRLIAYVVNQFGGVRAGRAPIGQER